MADNPNTAGNGADHGNQQQFNIAKIYLKDVSFEAPGAPEIFTAGEWKPEVQVELNTQAKKIKPTDFEVVLTVTVTAKLGEQTAYLCEVHQAGIFQLSGFEDQQLGGVLGAYCPAVLFPYAREAVSDLVAKGGFPQMLLGPVNFDALYAQQMQKQQNQQAQPGEGAPVQH